MRSSHYENTNQTSTINLHEASFFRKNNYNSIAEKGSTRYFGAELTNSNNLPNGSNSRTVFEQQPKQVIRKNDSDVIESGFYNKSKSFVLSGSENTMMRNDSMDSLSTMQSSQNKNNMFFNTNYETTRYYSSQPTQGFNEYSSNNIINNQEIHANPAFFSQKYTKSCHNIHSFFQGGVMPAESELEVMKKKKKEKMSIEENPCDMIRLCSNLEKVDQENMSNPQFVSLYSSEITSYLRKREADYSINSNYMHEIQSDITEKMRAILVDWLIDVHLKFKLLPETLFLTINITDRYLSKVSINRKILQLVGVSAMFIASKYEEIYAPELKDFVFVTDQAYTREEVLEMEGHILTVLGFDFGYASPLRFLDRYAKLINMEENNYYLVRYLIEIALIEYKMIAYLPSNIACSAIYLVHKIRKTPVWNEIMQRNTEYSENDIRPCAKDLCVILLNIDKSQLKAVRKKFSRPEFKEVAKIRVEKY